MILLAVSVVVVIVFCFYMVSESVGESFYEVVNSNVALAVIVRELWYLGQLKVSAKAMKNY